MKILDLLINILRGSMHELIEKFGILDNRTINISQRLDLIIIKK